MSSQSECVTMSEGVEAVELSAMSGRPLVIPGVPLPWLVFRERSPWGYWGFFSQSLLIAQPYVETWSHFRLVWRHSRLSGGKKIRKGLLQPMFFCRTGIYFFGARDIMQSQWYRISSNTPPYSPYRPVKDASLEEGWRLGGRYLRFCGT